MRKGVIKVLKSWITKLDPKSVIRNDLEELSERTEKILFSSSINDDFAYGLVKIVRSVFRLCMFLRYVSKHQKFREDGSYAILVGEIELCKRHLDNLSSLLNKN